jgi:hypothetical protein
MLKRLAFALCLLAASPAHANFVNVNVLFIEADSNFIICQPCGSGTITWDASDYDVSFGANRAHQRLADALANSEFVFDTNVDLDLPGFLTLHPNGLVLTENHLFNPIDFFSDFQLDVYQGGELFDRLRDEIQFDSGGFGHWLSADVTDGDSRLAVFSLQPVPEPSSLVMLFSALFLGIGYIRWIHPTGRIGRSVVKG